ncbi:hypothetical protein [Limnohabitans sp. WS1]|uniref:hypothetical protein n=1 Tax=Limnohabitans sp. WS1 TaxID=1100726 RepID=UPI000D3B44F4|nr:hypothetical protein [Limnohabitans sp. WS1]PUE13517.1 hypothetical protein B9Z48_15125 [Limnohabitans sp. WS1]
MANVICLQEEVTASVGAAIPQTQNKFSITAAMSTLAKMRADADNNYETYEVLGRKATRELMGRVYAMLCNAKASGQFGRLIANIRADFKQQDVKVKATSKDSSLLIRYIFTKASDKQVHVYGRALDVAYDEQDVAPAKFAEWVEKTEGGFEGIRSNSAATVDSTSKVKTALSKCQSERTLETIDKIDWVGNEDYKVIIAFRNADDTADLKDPCLSDEQQEATLLRYLAETKKADAAKKPKKPSKDAINMVKEMETKVIEQQSSVDQLSLEIEMYSEEGKPCEELRSMLYVENIKLNVISESLKIAKAALAA